LKVPLNTEICVFLMGSEVAPPRQPVDARNPKPHTPTEAPAIARKLLARLKTAS
jgi:hypothetical protein